MLNSKQIAAAEQLERIQDDPQSSASSFTMRDIRRVAMEIGLSCAETDELVSVAFSEIDGFFSIKRYDDEY